MSRRNPRIRAALCYAIPVVPAVLALHRERRNRFVRFHAAQSLLFFGGIALAQVVLFALLVVAGNLVGHGALAVAAGIVFLALFLALGVAGFLFWLRLLRDCIEGQATLFWFLGDRTMELEQLVTALQQRVAGKGPPGEK